MQLLFLLQPNQEPRRYNHFNSFVQLTYAMAFQNVNKLFRGLRLITKDIDHSTIYTRTPLSAAFPSKGRHLAPTRKSRSETLPKTKTLRVVFPLELAFLGPVGDFDDLWHVVDDLGGRGFLRSMDPWGDSLIKGGEEGRIT